MHKNVSLYSAIIIAHSELVRPLNGTNEVNMGTISSDLSRSMVMLVGLVGAEIRTVLLHIESSWFRTEISFKTVDISAPTQWIVVFHLVGVFVS